MKEAKKNDIDLQGIIDTTKNNKKSSTIESKLAQYSQSAKEAISDSIEHLSQYSTKLSHNQIIQQAFIFAAGKIDHNELENVISECLKNKSLIGEQDQYYTTKSLIATENILKKQLKNSKQTASSIDIKQSGIVADVFKSKDRIQIIDVKGLKNESNLINDLIHSAEQEKMNVYLLHQNTLKLNHISSSVSRNQTGFWTCFKDFFKRDLLQSVGKFEHEYANKLNRFRFFKSKKEDFIIVSDAQKLSYQDLSSLDRLSEKQNSKLIFLNNKESTGSFQAGNSMKILKESGVEQHYSKSNSKSVHVNIVESKLGTLDLIDRYLNDQNTYTIAVPTNKLQCNINDLIRSKLKEKQALSIEEVQFNVLSNKFLSDVELRKSKFYAQGDQVLLNPFSKEQITYRIDSIDHKLNELTLLDHDEQAIKMDLDSKPNIRVNKKIKMNFAVGDQLRVTRTIYLNDLKPKLKAHKFHENFSIQKNSLIEVWGISEDGIQISLDDKLISLDEKILDKSFIEYGYTAKTSQLKNDQTHILSILDGYQLNKNNLGDLTEFSNKVTLFTNDVKKTQKYLNEEKISWTAHEVSEGMINESKEYSPIIRTDQSIKKSLKKVVDSLLDSSVQNTDKSESAVAYALAKLGAREAAFKMKDLIKEAILYALGEVSSQSIDHVIQKEIEKNELLLFGDLLTTKSILKTEQEILKNVKDGHNKVNAIMPHNVNLDSYLTQGQKNAVSLSLKTEDRFIGIQGLAGTGKSTLLSEFKKHAESNGYHLIVAAPTYKSVQVLNASMNDIENPNHKVPVSTIHKLLIDIKDEKFKANEKTVFVIDESSMIGNQLYLTLQETVKSFNARAIFLGDITQQGSIEHGKPQELSLKYGMKYAVMNEMMRQNSNPKLKEAVILSAQNQPEKSLIALESINPKDYIKHRSDFEYESSFIEIQPKKSNQNKDEKEEKKYVTKALYKAISDDYLSRIPEQREQTVIVARLHEFRDNIDALIRGGLKEMGVITNEISASRLVSKNFTEVETLHAKNFKEGHILHFDKNYHVVRRDDFMRVMGIDTSNNTLLLQDLKSKREYNINPAKIGSKSTISVYAEVSASLGIGDKIRLKITDKSKNWRGGDEYTIKNINENKNIELINAQRSLSIDLSNEKDKIWDYAYTNTTYSIQGDTTKYFIGMEVDENHKAHYIQMSRASHHAVIYTHSKKWLLSRLQHEKNIKHAHKYSAYEIQDSSNKAKSIPTAPDIVTKDSKHFSDRHKSELPQQDALRKTPEITFKQYPEKIVYINKEKPILAEDIKPLLLSRIEELSINLLGAPNKLLSNRKTIRFGSKGSTVINTHTGQWFSHEMGVGGSIFELIESEINTNDFKSVLEYAAKFLNYPPEMQMIPKTTKDLNMNFDDQNKEMKMKNYAKTLYERSIPIRGTSGEKYLREHRGLSNYQNSDIRFLPSISAHQDGKKIFTPAIIAFSKDDQNEVHRVQVIRLNHDGSKNTHVDIAKQTYGKMRGYAVELNHDSTKEISYLTEGIETGLSILNVDKKAHVLSVLGKANFQKVNPEQLSDQVILCLDNDGVKSFRDNNIQDAISRLESSGKTVNCIIPNTQGYDFNDVLTKEGTIALSEQISQTIKPNEYQLMSEKFSLKADSNQFQGILKDLKQNDLEYIDLSKNDKYLKHIKIMDDQILKDQTENIIISENASTKDKEIY